MEKPAIKITSKLIGSELTSSKIFLSKKLLEYLKGIKGNEAIEFRSGWNSFKFGGCTSSSSCGAAPAGFYYACVGGNCTLLPIG